MNHKFLLHGVELIAVGRDSTRKAVERLSSCERCNTFASISFRSVLDEVLGRKQGITEYVLTQAAACPSCAGLICESSSIALNDVSDFDNQTALQFDFPLEQTDIILVDESQLLDAQACITACERCASNAEISFDYLLDAVTGCNPSVTEYVMSHPAKCPQCFREVTEKTLVIPE